MKTYWVYILASKTRRLYVGVSGNLQRRLAQHRAGKGSYFAARYGIIRLVHAESTTDVLSALRREKEIKGWRRSKKIALIEAANPGWTDLSSRGSEATEVSGSRRADPSLRSG